MPPVKKASVKVRLNSILTSLLFLQVAGYLRCPADLFVSQNRSSTVDVSAENRETSPFDSAVGSDSSALGLLACRADNNSEICRIDNNSDSSRINSDNSDVAVTPLMEGLTPSKIPENSVDAWLGNTEPSFESQPYDDASDKNALLAWFASHTGSVFHEIRKLKDGYSPSGPSYEKILLNIKNHKSFDKKKSYLLEQVKLLPAFPQDWVGSYEVDQQWGHLIINADLKSFEELCQYIVLMLTSRLEAEDARGKHHFCGQGALSVDAYIQTHKQLLGFSDKGPLMAGFKVPPTNKAVYQLIQDQYSSQSLFKELYGSYSFDWAGVLPSSYKNGHVILLIKKHLDNKDKVLFILKFGGRFDFVLPGGYVDSVDGADICTSAKLTAINEFGQEVCFCHEIQAALQGALLHNDFNSISVNYSRSETAKSHIFNISLPDEINIRFDTRKDSLESLAGIWLDAEQLEALLNGYSIEVETCTGSSCGGLVLTGVESNNFTYKQNLEQALKFLSQS